MGLRTTVLGVAAVGLVGAGVVILSDDPYTVDIVMPAATNLVEGSKVQIDGSDAGFVEGLRAEGGKAVVTVSLTDDFAPLHDGTTARISWKATLGERIVDLQPGPEQNATLADGALVEGTIDRVELDQVLAALDEPTRARLTSLVSRLDGTLDGAEDDLNATLRTAGPTVEALGEVLEALGTDGPAIKNLVSRLDELMAVLAARDREVASSVDDLGRASGVLGSRREQLSAALADLPRTLDVAEGTLDQVPGTVGVAAPLLRDLAPAAARLPAVSRKLGPLLTDLRPTIAQLRPTLASARALLRYTPGLLDGASSVVPQADQVLADLGPAVAYLRPYTPELAGWLSNWGSAAANYDDEGHYLRAFIEQGGTSVNHNPGVLPPGIVRRTTRYPGENEGQPWTDANGSGMQ